LGRAHLKPAERCSAAIEMTKTVTPVLDQVLRTAPDTYQRRKCGFN
jgi:hypothetical protein